MIDLHKLVEYKEYGVIMALIGVVVWIVKIFIEKIEKKDKRDEAMYCKLADSIDRNTGISNEMYLYLKLRNGNDTKNIMKAVKKYNERKEDE